MNSIGMRRGTKLLHKQGETNKGSCLVSAFGLQWDQLQQWGQNQDDFGLTEDAS
jgi:hypothetical protein